MDYLYLGFFILVLISFFTGILISAIGYSMVVIDNPDPNSMWPTYFQGDLFVLQDANPEDIGLGDVVVYEKSNGDKIIHRVIDIVIINNQYFFRVKGDNPISNSTPDPSTNLTTLISSDSILGKIVYRIPYLGHLSLAMQRNAGIQLFVYFIAVLLGVAIVFWPEDEEEGKISQKESDMRKKLEKLNSEKDRIEKELFQEKMDESPKYVESGKPVNPSKELLNVQNQIFDLESKIKIEMETNRSKEEFFDINSASVKAFFVALVTFPIIFVLRVKNSKHRILITFGSILLIFLLILPAFIPSFISISSTKEGVGVLEINSSRTTQYTETQSGQSLDYSFTQVEITLYDNEGFWNRIKGFTLTAFSVENDLNSLISRTKWISLRDFKGIITVGASLVIDKDDQPADNSTIYLVVTLNWVEFFIEKSEEYHTDIIYQSA